MLHHRMRRAVAGGGGGGGGPYTAKIVIIDAADDHGLGVLAFREMAFWFEGAELPLVSADMASFGSTSDNGLTYAADNVFDTSLSPVGSSANTTWIEGSPYGGVNQRIWVKWATPIVFDSIVIINYHDSGNTTTAGINNAVVSITEDTTDPSSAYGAAITGGVVIYNSVFREHIASDVADPETLVLI